MATQPSSLIPLNFDALNTQQGAQGAAASAQIPKASSNQELADLLAPPTTSTVPLNLPSQDENASSPIGTVQEWITHPVESAESDATRGRLPNPAADLSDAWINDIKHNSVLLSAARLLSGNTQFDQQAAGLTAQQAQLTAKIHSLQLAPSRNAAEIAATQEQLNGITTQLSAMNKTILQNKWSSMPTPAQVRANPQMLFGGVPNLHKDLQIVKDAAISFAKSPWTTIKNFGDQMLADPELLGAGISADAFDATKSAAALRTVTKAVDKVDTIAKASTDLSSSGIIHKAVTAQALYTPLSVASTIDHQGTVSKDDVLRLMVQNLSLMTVTGVGRYIFKPGPSLYDIQNKAAAAGVTLTKAAEDLGIDTRNTAKETVSNNDRGETVLSAEHKGPKIARGLTASIIEVPNEAYSFLQTLAKTGGSYKADDFIEPGLRNRIYDNKALQLDQFNAAYKASPAQGLVGLQPISQDLWAHTSYTGFKQIAQVVARETPASFDVFDMSADGTQRVYGRLVQAHAALADKALENRKVLNSPWELDPGEMKLWTKGLRARGYTVEQSPFSIYDASLNRTMTVNGEPLFRVTAKEGGPTSEEADVAEAADAVNKQAGRIDPKLLVGMGLVGGAAAYGYSQGGPSAAARDATVMALGAIFGPLAAGRVRNWKLNNRIGSIEPSASVFEQLRNTSSELNAIPIIAQRIRYAIRDTVNGNYDNLAAHLYGDPSAKPLTPEEATAASYIKKILSSYGARAKASGVIENPIDDYFMRWWKPGPGSELKGNWSKGNFRFTRSLGTGTDAFKAASEMGLVPVSSDVGEMMQNYVLSMHRAIALKETAASISNLTDSDGEKLIQPWKDAPRNYVSLRAPAFNNMKAHPDVALAINMLYDFPEPGMIAKAYDATVSTLKRALLSFSIFHPKNLGMNYIMATQRSDILPAFSFNGEFQKAFKGNTGELSDAILKSAQRGVTYAINTTSEDLGNVPYYRALDGLSNTLDKVSTVFGAVPKGLKAVSKFSDRLAFETAQNYFKYHTWDMISQKGKQAALSRHLLNPDKYPLPNEEEIERKAANVVNDLYGSQNYYQMVDMMKPGLIKHVMGTIFSPRGRRGLQRVILAPDWTISVARSFTGIARDSGSRAAYGRYLLGAMGAYLAAAGASYIVNGTFPWQTLEQPGYMVGPDGTRIQWDKQIAEMMEYGEKPGQAALNKLGPIVKLGAETVLNKTYLSPGEAPHIYNTSDSGAERASKVVYNMLKQSLPIGGQQGLQTGLRGVIGSEIGFPIYNGPPPQAVSFRRGTPEWYRARIAARMHRIEGMK